MNDNRTVKRTKSSRTKEMEENDDDEDDSERRKVETILTEVNGNIIPGDNPANKPTLVELSNVNHINGIDNYSYREYADGQGNYDMTTLGRDNAQTGAQTEKKVSGEHEDVEKSCCGGNKNTCPSECEYWRSNLASDVKNSYWHCLEVENYSNNQNTCSPCPGNNINRLETTGDNIFCEKSDCIYLPFENVTKEKSCFRKNCSCNQKYLTKNPKTHDKKHCSVKKNEILLSPSSLSRSNEDYNDCSCSVSNCCENDRKQSEIYFTNHSSYRRAGKKTMRSCDNREKKTSNHFKDKVNQVLPNLMAAVGNCPSVTEKQSGRSFSRNNPCLDNSADANYCDNCQEYNINSSLESNNVNKHFIDDTNRLVPNDSIVPENSVPLTSVKYNNVCTTSSHPERVENKNSASSVRSDVGEANDCRVVPKIVDSPSNDRDSTSQIKEKFLNIEIKLNSDGLQNQERSSYEPACIIESVSEESSKQSPSVETNLKYSTNSESNNSAKDESGLRTKGEILEVNRLITDNVATSSKYLTSPLRNPRRKVNREQRPKSIPERKAKKQFYTPYEEALSSLLWQPYDCRNSGLSTMDVSDMSDSEDMRRNLQRSRRKSGSRSMKHDQRLVEGNMSSYLFSIPPEYAMMGDFQNINYNQFIGDCDPSLLCRNCKINLFVEDNDEFRGMYFCFNCKELKRFLNENNRMSDSDLMKQLNIEKSAFGSLDGACGSASLAYSSIPSGSKSVLPNQLVPNFYLKSQIKTKHHHSRHKNMNELARRPKHQDNDTCSSTLSSTYSSTSSLSSLDLAPPGAPLCSSQLDTGGSGTQPTAPAQFSSVPSLCRLNVDQAESRQLHSETTFTTQTKKLKPRFTNNVDGKMLVNISNSNHNLSLSQSNLLSNSNNNLISVVTHNSSSNSCDNGSENLVNIVSCYRAVPVTTSSSCENNQTNHHESSDNQTYNSPSLVQNGGGVGSGSSHLKNVSRCVSSVSVPGNGLPPPPPSGVGLAKPLPTPSGSRTFISTEAQTDEIILNRDQRRRERRERRQQRRLAQQLQQWPSVPPEFPQDRVPDILHSHVPPPYSTLPLGVVPCSTSLPPSLSSPPSLMHPSLPNLPPPSHCGSPLHPPPSHNSGGVTTFAGIRFPFTIVPTGRRR